MSDALDFDRAARRIARNMIWIGVMGTLAAGVARGWPWAAGFLLGAAISWVNYRWLKRLVESLGGGKRQPGGLRFAIRYLLLGGGTYVILRLSPISVPAVLAGLFVLIAAVLVETAYEIFYAGKRTLDHQDF